MRTGFRRPVSGPRLSELYYRVHGQVQVKEDSTNSPLRVARKKCSRALCADSRRWPDPQCAPLQMRSWPCKCAGRISRPRLNRTCLRTMTSSGGGCFIGASSGVRKRRANSVYVQRPASCHAPADGMFFHRPLLVGWLEMDIMLGDWVSALPPRAVCNHQSCCSPCTPLRLLLGAFAGGGELAETG